MSDTITGIVIVPPYVPAETPLVGNLEAFNVPELILEAFVVSVVAEADKPETAPLEIAIGVDVIFVTRPNESTV